MGPALEGHTELISCLEFSPDGGALASGSHDNTLRLWDVETGVQKKRLLGLASTPNLLQLSLSGHENLTTSEDASRWDVGVEALVFHESYNNELAPIQASLYQIHQVAARIAHGGWVRYVQYVCSGSPFPRAFGQNPLGELRDNRFIFSRDCNVCILDVSDILYLME